MSTLIGIVTFGNLPFTKLTIRGIKETVTEPYSIYAIVGKPNDIETAEWLSSESIPHLIHDQNYGFPYSLNDIYDFAWKFNNFDNLVIIGNDVIPYPHAIDSLIKIADTTDYEWICSSQIDSKSMVLTWPWTRRYFEGPTLIFSDFDARPWEKVPIDYSDKIEINPTPMSDVHNLALYKKSVFDKIGYIDVNFYPAYYSDNDYVRRALHAGITSCTASNSIYFHFWSRTIHQETGGSTHIYFNLNRVFYIMKWGNDFGKEAFDAPFDGKPYQLGETVLQPDIKIDSREQELKIINHWKTRGR
jgi:GT2 family glycosyltransferase